MSVPAKPIAGAILGSSLGLLLALGLERVVDPDRGRELGAYAIGTLPLTIVAGAIAGARSRRAPEGGSVRAMAGLGLALGAAVVVAWIQASLRFRYLGSNGFLFGTTVFYTKEVLMLVGALPVIAGLGAVLATRPPKAGPWFAAVGAGAVTSLLVGPTLVLVSLRGGR